MVLGTPLTATPSVGLHHHFGSFIHIGHRASCMTDMNESGQAPMNGAWDPAYHLISVRKNFVCNTYSDILNTFKSDIPFNGLRSIVSTLSK